MVEEVKNSKTHHQNIPADAYCCWCVGDEGGRPNFSLWAEFWPFWYWDRNYVIVKKTEMYLKKYCRKGEK